MMTPAESSFAGPRLRRGWSRWLQRPPMILVADDDPIVREWLSLVLQRQGYQVEAAEDGREALAIASEHHPKAIILDAHMPELDGFATLMRLKDDRSVAPVPVLMLSADDQPAVMRRAMEAGAAEFLTKPVIAADIVYNIAKLCRH